MSVRIDDTNMEWGIPYLGLQGIYKKNVFSMLNECD